MSNVRLTIYLLVLLIIAFSCTNNRLDVDTRDVVIDPIVIKRLDKDLFTVNTTNIDDKTKSMVASYGTFYNRFTSSIINRGGIVDSLYTQSVLRFVNDADMQEAYKEVQKKFSENDVKAIEEASTEVFKRFHYFFPNRKLPKQVETYVSGFNYNIVYVDSTIGISLDMYLGTDSKFYTMLQWPQYRTRLMRKECIIPDMVRGWLITEFDQQESNTNLLSHMLFYGKILYGCDALLPNAEDSLKIGYSSAQIAYCHKYEKKLWGFFADKNKLYENDLKLIAEFTSDGPFTATISKECPPRIAMWMGWQIVRSFMNNNSEITLEQLMDEKDAQKILTKSKYRP